MTVWRKITLVRWRQSSYNRCPLHACATPQSLLPPPSSIHPFTSTSSSPWPRQTGRQTHTDKCIYTHIYYSLVPPRICKHLIHDTYVYIYIYLYYIYRSIYLSSLSLSLPLSLYSSPWRGCLRGTSVCACLSAPQSARSARMTSQTPRRWSASLCWNHLTLPRFHQLRCCRTESCNFLSALAFARSLAC